MQLESQTIRPTSHKRAALIRVGVLIVLLIAAAVAGHFFGWFEYRSTLARIDHLRKTHGFAEFSLLFVLIFGFVSAVGFPGLPFLIVAGAMFGTWLGSVLAWGGAMLGAIGGYWLARTVGHEKVARAIAHSRRAEAAVSQARSFGGLLRLRLVPVLPLGVVNFAGGLAKAPFSAYMLATAIGVFPSTVIYAYFADSLLDSAGSGRIHALRSLTVASVLLLVLSFAPRLVRSRS